MAVTAHPVRTVAILGAGCAGTLLAVELRRRGFAGHVELFDARTDFTREQRWCFWRKRTAATHDLPIDVEWQAWQVADGLRTIRHASNSFVYSHVYAPDFYRRFHGRLAEDPRVGLHLGHRVSSVRKHSGGQGAFSVETKCGELRADVVIDARHGGTPAYERVTASESGLLWQTFCGRVLEFDDECFDPGTVTLMDFRVQAAGAGLAFVYVLPFTKTRALVEAVVLDRDQATATELEAMLTTYAEERFGSKGETFAVEVGVLPMTTRAFAPCDADAGIALGVGGGAVRPSSGYAFANTMRAARRAAAALCAGQPVRQLTAAWKYRALDALFLRLLQTDPPAARRAFMAMFAGVEPGRLVRFLTETSSLRDDLALGFALPKTAFLKALLPMLGPDGPGRVWEVRSDALRQRKEASSSSSEWKIL